MCWGILLFESFVNSERCKTMSTNGTDSGTFESFVNSERCKTPGMPESLLLLV